jgi:hypothetical protein
MTDYMSGKNSQLFEEIFHGSFGNKIGGITFATPLKNEAL